MAREGGGHLGVWQDQSLGMLVAAWVKGRTEMRIVFSSPSLPLDVLRTSVLSPSVTEPASPLVSQHLSSSSPRVLSWGEAPAAPTPALLRGRGILCSPVAWPPHLQLEQRQSHPGFQGLFEFDES